MKLIKHTINGEEKTLDFGRMYYLKFAGEFFKGDPLVLTAEAMKDPSKQFQFCTALVYAGINCHNQVNSLPLISIDEAERTVGMMTEEEATDLIFKYHAVMYPTQGEA